MKAIRKKVGQLPEVIEINNTLKDLQREVGGYIQPVTSVVIKGGIFIVNEEGILQNLEENCWIEGYRFFGNIIFVGTNGEDFTDVPQEALDRYEKQKKTRNLGPDHWCWR